MTVRKLKNTFINNKTTGTERLMDLSFREPEPTTIPTNSESPREIPLLDKPSRTTVGKVFIV